MEIFWALPFTRARHILIVVGRARRNLTAGWNSGFEAMLLKRLTGQFHGQISYSFAVSKRNDRDGFGEYTSPSNQPYNLSVLFGHQINDEWFVSAKWKYAVGRPADRFVVHENVLGDDGPLRFSKEVTARNAERLYACRCILSIYG